MSFVRLHFDVAGEAQYSRAFQAYEREVDDMRDPLGRIRDQIAEGVAGQFATEGARGGTPWEPLDPAYEQWKATHYPGAPIMVRSGTLFDQLVRHGTRELSEHRLEYGIDPDAVNEDGTRVEIYAVAHQTGRGVVPQRKLLALTEADKRQFDREFVEWLNGLRHRMAVLS